LLQRDIFAAFSLSVHFTGLDGINWVLRGEEEETEGVTETGGLGEDIGIRRWDG